MYQFLQEYDAESKQYYESMLTRAFSRLPYTLSFPIAQAQKKLEDNSFSATMNHILDFFEIATQYSACVVFRILQNNSSSAAQSVITNIINKIDNKRPLSFGDWVNDIFSPLMLTAAKVVPQHPIVASLSENVCNRKRNLLLGGKHEASIVQIRNEYRGHSTTLSDDIYKGVSFTLEPRLLQFIKGLMPLTVYSAVAADCNNMLWSLTGSDATVPFSGATDISSKPEHYYLCSQSETIDLYPLVFFSNEHFVYVFQSLKDENISYISSNINAVTLITDERNEDFDCDMQRFLPSFDIAKDVNWEEVISMAQAESFSFINRVYSEKKYNQELFVERTALSEALHEFWNSDATLFPMLGEAGQGKTSQLCFWTENLLDDKRAVLIFSCSDFGSKNLEDHLKRVFGFSYRKPVAKLLDSLHKKAEAADDTLYFFFDALNECLHYKDCEQNEESPLALFNDIRKLLISRNYPRFKVLFTCRTFTWKNLLQRYVKNDDGTIFNADGDERYNVRGFSIEETRQAYEIYSRLYQMRTSFNDIDQRVLIRLSDPLVMKFTCTNFLSRALTSDTSEYTSLSLFHKMMTDIRNSYAGNMQCLIVSAIAGYFVSNYLNGNAIDSILSDELKAAYIDPCSPLHQLATLIYKKDGITIAYAELLNKAERPILRESRRADESSASVQFVYERFLEYAMAMEFYKVNAKSNGSPIATEVYINALTHASVNVVWMGCLRNVLIIDAVSTGSFDTIVRLATDHSDNYLVMQLITDSLDTLIKENYETQLFSLLDLMLDFNIDNGNALTLRFNEVNKRIESDNADDAVIAEHKRLSALLAPVMRLRQLASVSVINGLLLTDYCNNDLYSRDAFDFLWKLMTDPIIEVRNDACMYCYYLSNKHYTLNYSPLKRNLSELIVARMYEIIKSHSLVVNMASGKLRTRAITFLETATRLCTLLIIDALVTHRNRQLAADLLGEITGIIRYFTLNFSIVRLFMPFLQIIMRKQITFQSVYVNNAIEYQSFWDSSVVACDKIDGKWTQKRLPELMSFLSHYHKFASNSNTPECIAEQKRFADFHRYILSAYGIGDSFSFFAIERVMVIMGATDWNNISPIVTKFFTPEFRKNEWFDYSQMSMLYVLYQVGVHSANDIDQLLEIYTQECEDWTYRCRGIFKARNSRKANPMGLYKRNVLNWYCVVYCAHQGDGVAHQGDERCVPLVYRLINRAINDKDKELLYHIVENTSELITDFGYIHTALDIVKYILTIFDTEEKVRTFDAIAIERQGCYQYDLVRLFGDLFSTAKNYFPDEINSFLKKDIAGLSFPGVSSYRDEILNYNPSGETLSDLLTHKFGNFLMWALLNEEAVDNFAVEAMNSAIEAKDCFNWYDKTIRILFKHMFGLNI